jgi:predicted nucleic acid-binding protein
MIYAHKVRMEKEDVFGVFDCPDAGQSMARRRQSTTPLQALNLFNSPFTIHEANAFAARVVAETQAGHEPGTDPVARQVVRAYELAFARSPDADELAEATAVVREHGLATLCRAIFNANEFLFLP